MINAIAAIGRSGQLGLDGKLPWHDTDDLAWFARMTTGHILVAGHNTKANLPDLVGRTVLYDNRDMHPISYLAHLGCEDIWIIGGAKTYARWAPYIERWYISKVDYDGHADTWFDPAWLVARRRMGVQ